jgi:hypothetical protein
MSKIIRIENKCPAWCKHAGIEPCSIQGHAAVELGLSYESLLACLSHHQYLHIRPLNEDQENQFEYCNAYRLFIP